MKFLIVIHKDVGSDFGVTVPDLPGCFSAGSNLEDAVANAREAIALHVAGLRAAGQAFTVVDGAVHRGNPDYSDGIWHVVDVDV